MHGFDDDAIRTFQTLELTREMAIEPSFIQGERSDVAHILEDEGHRAVANIPRHCPSYTDQSSRVRSALDHMCQGDRKSVV